MEREEMLERIEKGEDLLEISIQKWQDIVDGVGEENGTHNCALCQAYWMSSNDICTECPVFMQTGFRFCGGTPYDDYTEAESENADSGALRELAREELAYLQSLRDGKKRVLKDGKVIVT